MSRVDVPESRLTVGLGLDLEVGQGLERRERLALAVAVLVGAGRGPARQPQPAVPRFVVLQRGPHAGLARRSPQPAQELLLPAVFDEFQQQGLKAVGLQTDSHLAVFVGLDAVLAQLALPLALPQVQAELVGVVLRLAEYGQAELLPEDSEPPIEPSQVPLDDLGQQPANKHPPKVIAVAQPNPILAHHPHEWQSCHRGPYRGWVLGQAAQCPPVLQY
jgi:hypothetical protein